MSRRCKNLVLDSGPLLSLSPLRGLADTYLTVPQVLDELKDKRAREHFHQLGLSTGVQISIRSPDPASITQVIQLAKKTGDYTVLSHADICVLALTHTLQLEENATLEKERQEIHSNSTEDEEVPQSATGTVCAGDTQDISVVPCPDPEQINSSQLPSAVSQIVERADITDLNRATSDLSIEPRPDSSFPENEPHGLKGQPPGPEVSASKPTPEGPLYDDPLTDDDDGFGEWITLDNVALHKSRALDLLPSSDGDPKKRRQMADEETVLAGCMTADFAMQNVLLQMGLALVGTEGKRIQKVKTWVLRCHACFKICKDNSKQFCPSCGNPTLLRASVTISSPNAAADAPVMQLHLKKNFQYKLRGTKYSIPAPRSGSAKTGSGEGLILREDQLEYMRAKKRADGKRERDEQRMLKGLVDRGGEGGVAVGSWSDPDWIPGILGGSAKGRSGGRDGMPRIGYGRKNPNEKRKH
ncbi:Nin one binding Zn-ribbon like-domain-containing protein [Boletus edulis BED1]|uniref:20S-pre-rRNA D-site endonuclease NOB1 n=1 Tax=Boletus edulis BED1 TaxID=1328754 RepID=A0AAD4GM31_BOLED|nr:Nin one binding Zn-ribbon like-domain-containing protein [Boletus edulis BED1]